MILKKANNGKEKNIKKRKEKQQENPSKQRTRFSMCNKMITSKNISEKTSQL